MMTLQYLGTFLIASISLRVGVDGAKCGMAADVAFILDSSRSISQADFVKLRDFVNVLVDKFDVGPDKTRVAALQFGSDVRVEFDFNFDGVRQTAADVKQKISAISQAFGRTTYTHLALKSLRTDIFQARNGARPGVPQIAILLSDGASTRRVDTSKEAIRTKAANITMLAIGIGRYINEKELRDIVSPPSNKNYFFAANFDELKNFETLVGNQACPQKEDSKKTCQGKEADVIFVLDKSSSIWSVDFQRQLEFVTHVVNVFDVGSGKTRVGAATFSDGAEVIFNLDRYQSEAEVREAILNIPYSGGLTNTHLALQLVAEQMLTKTAGSRPGVAHIAIVITDGESREQAKTVQVAQKLHDRGVYVFAIGVGNNTNSQELSAISSQPATNFMFEVNGYDALPPIKDILAYKACKVEKQRPKPGTMKKPGKPL